MSSLKDYALLFNALADEFRLKILLYLYINGEKCVCDISAYFNITQSSISYHLKILSDANVINKKQVAVWNYYSVNKNSSMYNTLKETFKNINKEKWRDNNSNE